MSACSQKVPIRVERTDIWDITSLMYISNSSGLNTCSMTSEAITRSIGCDGTDLVTGIDPASVRPLLLKKSQVAGNSMPIVVNSWK